MDAERQEKLRLAREKLSKFQKKKRDSLVEAIIEGETPTGTHLHRSESSNSNPKNVIEGALQQDQSTTENQSSFQDDRLPSNGQALSYNNQMMLQEALFPQNHYV